MNEINQLKIIKLDYILDKIIKKNELKSKLNFINNLNIDVYNNSKIILNLELYKKIFFKFDNLFKKKLLFQKIVFLIKLKTKKQKKSEKKKLEKEIKKYVLLKNTLDKTKSTVKIFVDQLDSVINSEILINCNNKKMNLKIKNPFIKKSIDL